MFLGLGMVVVKRRCRVGPTSSPGHIHRNHVSCEWPPARRGVCRKRNGIMVQFSPPRSFFMFIHMINYVLHTTTTNHPPPHRYLSREHVNSNTFTISILIKIIIPSLCYSSCIKIILRVLRRVTITWILQKTAKRTPSIYNNNVECETHFEGKIQTSCNQPDKPNRSVLGTISFAVNCPPLSIAQFAHASQAPIRPLITDTASAYESASQSTVQPT